jgi:hypothetical protein
MIVVDSRLELLVGSIQKFLCHFIKDYYDIKHLPLPRFGKIELDSKGYDVFAEKIF